MSTNIRIGPGFYLAIKQLSESSGASMGTITNLLLMLGFYSVTKEPTQGMFSSFSADIQAAPTADVLSTIGDVFKLVGLEAVRNTGIADLYQSLLNPRKDSNVV